MSRDPRVYLEDILESIRRIRTYVEGIDQNGLGADELRLDAVVRNLEVIGEAAKRVPEKYREQHPSVPWRQLAGFRDVLIHQYDGVSIAGIWEIVEQDLADAKGRVGCDPAAAG